MRARHIALLLVATAACGESAPPAAERDAAVASSCAMDSECDDGDACSGVERCAAGRCVAGARVVCDDGDPCTIDACQRADGTCSLEPRDADGDGHGDDACGGDDCDDGDAQRYAGGFEVCDAASLDEDCDPSTVGTRDADGDGAIDARCCNGAVCGDDCDDMHPGVHPAEAEDCDGLDNDCDGVIDDGVAQPFLADADRDGFGASGSSPVMACRAPDAHAAVGGDCDDTTARVSPGLPEVCDTAGVDENCDGTANPPARCACTGAVSRSCPLPGVCAAGVERCIDGAWSECTIAALAETCNGADDDCDGAIDDGLRIDCWTDADNDTYPAADAAYAPSCPAVGRTSFGACPAGRTHRDPATIGAALDCDDLRATSRPGAPERSNGIDDDCDGVIDESI